MNQKNKKVLNIVMMPLRTTLHYVKKILKKLKKISIFATRYLPLFWIFIATILYLDTAAIAQQQVLYLPFDLSYASLFNFGGVILAWSFSVRESLIAADYRAGKSLRIIEKEAIIAFILGTLVFIIAYLDWNNYSINAFLTIILMAFLVAQTAVSRMVIMTRSYARSIHRVKPK